MSLQPITEDWLKPLLVDLTSSLPKRKQSKRIRVFAFPSHLTKQRTTGVDFARVIQPMRQLGRDSDFEVIHFDINRKTDWLWVSQNVDIIFFNYLHNPWGYAAMGAMARKHGVKLVLDLDDSLWDIATDNPAYKVFHYKSEALMNFNAICKDVDYITTTNSYLRNVIVHNALIRHEKVKIIPNYVDLELYSHISPFKPDPYKVTLLHMGSTTHFHDLRNPEFEKGMEMIMDAYPNVVFKTVGALIQTYKEKWGMRYFNSYGHEDIYQCIKSRFREFMDEADIIVTPLIDNVCNRCKSNIKFLEVSSAKKVGCFSNLHQYQEVIRNGENGFLCRTAQDWYDNLKYLIGHPEKRRKMGEQAYKDIEKDWTIQGNIWRYAEFFKSI